MQVRIDVLSLFLGASIVAGALFLIGAVQGQGGPFRVVVANPVALQGMPPHPRDWVQIEEGVPFVVPVGKLFVPTAAGRGVGGGGANLRVDGVNVFQAFGGNGSTTSFDPVPPGLAITAGRVVTVVENGQDSRAWGYLVDC